MPKLSDVASPALRVVSRETSAKPFLPATCRTQDELRLPLFVGVATIFFFFISFCLFAFSASRRAETRFPTPIPRSSLFFFSFVQFFFSFVQFFLSFVQIFLSFFVVSQLSLFRL
ncbi:unnamed protein product [Microthlaspi erraticum]|uniref:Transmembrane protein n=1 Tax=Microthlaspi erraticum TaxID=1685480 RepID=A0A6D2KE48_9BRAS|nr:unnamed protein product [Microthlaspi erraticum]